MSSIVAVVQARMHSTRLPGKVLMDIMGKPMLWHIINRMKRATRLDEIAIATTTREEDRAVIQLARGSQVGSYAGDEDDVLDRYYQAAALYKADIIVRITADCPLIDPRVVDKVVRHFLEGGFDYVSNALQLTYPDGLDTEVFSFHTLERAWKEAKWASEREHVTPYIWKNPDKFRLANVENDISLSHLRWTVDEEEDFEFVRQVYKYLYKEGEVFYMEDILSLLGKYPELKQINQGIPTNEGYAKSLREDRVLK